MDKVKAVAQDVAEQGKAALDEVSAAPKSTTPSQQGPAPANGPAPTDVSSPPPSTSGYTPEPDLARQLRDLAKLRDEGILTDEEFSAQKAKLLAI